jgi:branched-chain amino acid transport system ATP-binding protein
MAAMASVTPLLETRGLGRTFGGLKAVDGVDFTLRQGEIRAIIGPNGAGKTTFVGLVCGRVSPSAGKVVFDGEDITALPAHRRVRKGIAYTFQITSIFGKLTVFDNVALSVQRALLHRGGLNASALRRGVMEALERTGLAGRASETAGNLAYGHQRLLEVAMGLALKPRLLILDEPTQGLSVEETAEAVETLARFLHTTRMTVLLVEHDMEVVFRLAHRITVLHRGSVIADDVPEAVRADARVQEAYLGGMD